jgi:hypothetical protein
MWGWESTFNGTTGGIQPKSATPLNPNSGTGGVTITSINGVTVVALTSGQSCNGVFDGSFNGNITVSPGQNCMFTNNCEINGNVEVNGGSVNLACTVNGNVTESAGSLVLAPSARAGGNVTISGMSAFNFAAGVTIGGNLQIQQLSGA